MSLAACQEDHPCLGPTASTLKMDSIQTIPLVNDHVDLYISGNLGGIRWHSGIIFRQSRICRFPEIGLPPLNHPFLDGIFHGSLTIQLLAFIPIQMEILTSRGRRH